MHKEDDPKDITDEQSDDDPLEDDYYWSEDEGCWSLISQKMVLFIDY